MIAHAQSADGVFTMLDGLVCWWKGELTTIIIPKDLSLHYELSAWFHDMLLSVHFGSYCIVGSLRTTRIVCSVIVGIM